MKTYTFEDGKYEVDREEKFGTMEAMRRNGEPWPEGYDGFRFSKFVHAMLNRIDELQTTVDEVHSWIVCAAIAPPEDMMQNAGRIIEITGPKP